MSGACVLAVCGGAEHFERAARSIARLRRHGARRIVLVTDPARNRSPLPQGVEVLNVEVEPRWSDAQAAILLKTGIAEALDDGEVHLYLDSDVFAIADGVEAVFAHWAPPVVFASDLPFPEATLRTFGPFAYRCPCGLERERMERFFERLEALTALHRAQGDLAALADPRLYERPRFTGERGRQGAWWNGRAEGGWPDGSIRFEQEFRAGAPVAITYRFAGSPFSLVRDTAGAERFEDGLGPPFAWIEDAALAGGGYWQDAAGDSLRRRLDAAGEVRLWYGGGEPRKRWIARADASGGGVWADLEGRRPDGCDHLAEALERRFSLAIPDREWVPWNGGVFLFGPGSRPFFADWSERCRRLFEDEDFRVRDQGALVASAFALGLAGQPRLPRAFNRLVDRRAPEGRSARLAALRAEGARLVHLIGGGAEDLDWELPLELSRD